ncbi:MAG: immunity protein 19 [Clostridiales bacterium]|nr:immunity protein 19 [Clostridiales bacterium]
MESRKIVDHIQLLSNTSFINWFVMTSFPEGIDVEEDSSLSEMLSSSPIDKECIHQLTQYYDGVFDEYDGYVECPNAIRLDLNGNEYDVEFHPGDTVYYLNGEQLGCTGPEYFTKKIPLDQFKEFSQNLSSKEKLFLLPMLKATAEEKEEVFQIIDEIMQNFELSIEPERLSKCIWESVRER